MDCKGCLLPQETRSFKSFLFLFVNEEYLRILFWAHEAGFYTDIWNLMTEPRLIHVPNPLKIELNGICVLPDYWKSKQMEFNAEVMSQYKRQMVELRNCCL